MAHFVNPAREYFFQFSTGSISPFGNSGSLDMWSVKNYLIDNSEWVFATGVPQTRINWIGTQRGITNPSDSLSLTGSNFIHSEGPFIMNLSPEGDSLPLYVKVLAQVTPAAGEQAEVLMKVHLRSSDTLGQIFSTQEVGSFYCNSTDYIWYELTSSVQHTDMSSSLIQAPRRIFKRKYPIQTRSSRSLNDFNTVSRVPLFYLDIWAITEDTSSLLAKRVEIAGLYAQEISISGAL